MPNLTDRYELHDVLYSDAYVVAYRAHDRLLNRAVTVELLQARYAVDPTLVQRLIDKARQAALTSLPYVAALYDQHVVDGRPFVVLEEPVGPPLREVAPLPAHHIVALISAVAELQQAAIARQQPLPTINEQTVRVGPEGQFQVLDLGLEDAPADPTHAVAVLSRLLTAALKGTTEIQRATPLQRLAERAATGNYASPQALVDDLHAVERQANQATTVMPRAQPTVDMHDAADVPGVNTAPPQASRRATSRPSKRVPVKALIGALAVALLLLGGALLRERDEAGVGPARSSAPAAVEASTGPGASTATGEAYVVDARGSQTVRVRSGPGTGAPQVASLRNGTVVQVISQPQTADGYRWVRIVADGVEGWCILEALRKQ